jgi:hypothetical protein
MALQVRDTWDPTAKMLHEQNLKAIEESLVSEFGAQSFDVKKRNYLEIGPKRASILAFHNKFYEQVRNAFVVGSYYPALTGACALGERILNHLVLKLRDFYIGTPEYKSVYRKDSFDDWSVPISVLKSWNILLPDAVVALHSLASARNRAIHFNPEVDLNEKELALEAIKLLQKIIEVQFSAWGPMPWAFIVPGEIYIKKDWENHPFIKKVYLPSCVKVGPGHEVLQVLPAWQVKDGCPLTCPEDTDDQFALMRQEFLKRPKGLRSSD